MGGNTYGTGGFYAQAWCRIKQILQDPLMQQWCPMMWLQDPIQPGGIPCESGARECNSVSKMRESREDLGSYRLRNLGGMMRLDVPSL
jgi:hypothetical protein